MKAGNTSQERQHQEHREWLSMLDFYKEQIAAFENGLQQVVHHHAELLSIIEHVDEYRAILGKKKIHLEDFSQRIQEHEKALCENEPSLAELEVGHERLRNELQAFQSEMEALKPTFRRFVAYND